MVSVSLQCISVYRKAQNVNEIKNSALYVLGTVSIFEYRRDAVFMRHFMDIIKPCIGTQRINTTGKF
jgi:hypothetical protein